jgi:hypothetical protein
MLYNGVHLFPECIMVELLVLLWPLAPDNPDSAPQPQVRLELWSFRVEDHYIWATIYKI